MEVIKFSLDLSDFNRKDWKEDIESTALWLHDFLSRDIRYNREHEFDKVKDFDFAYTINGRYRRDVVFIKSEAPKINLRVFRGIGQESLNISGLPPLFLIGVVFLLM